MPSPVTNQRNTRMRTGADCGQRGAERCGGAARAVCVAGGLLVLLATTASSLPGCAENARLRAAREASRFYPPDPQPPRVVALGNLRGTPTPTQTEVNLSLFLFGAEPLPAMAITNPGSLTVSDDHLLICDSTLSMVLRCDPSSGGISELPLRPALQFPFAIDIAPDGDRLIGDRGGVRRVDATGQTLRWQQPATDDFKPGGVLAVGDEVWVSNLVAHRVEILDGASGQPVRSIGAHGRAAGEFSLPRALARTPDGNVCVVDVLNCRVQVFNPQGKWLRTVGQAGDNVGCFGRPRAVAVGPDGTIFVADTFSQRVHAFSADGQPLLGFGEPGSGVGALALPGGIAITTVTPQTDERAPENASPEYYVLVSEQLNHPGIRAFAWLGGPPVASTAPMLGGEAVTWRPSFPGSVAINPHWDAERCHTCHTAAEDRIVPIPPAQWDTLCLSCHDGIKAPADPHPIGRPASTELVATPSEWPAVDGMIGCLTCHDIKRHCSPSARRPLVNYVLLRGLDPQRPLEYCSTCHRTEISGRFSPHRQRDAAGKVRDDACLFCHTQRPEIPGDGLRRFQPHLRVESSKICLNCHSRHWDLSPLGHVDRPITPNVRAWMLMRELSRKYEGNRQKLEVLAAEHGREPAHLPLGDNRVTCYTCHNPHYAGLFPPNSELGALAANAEDRRSALRTDWIDLCSECHHR